MTGAGATLLVARREAVERARSRAFIVSTVVTIVLLGGIVALQVLLDPGPPEYRIGLAGDAPPALEAALEATAAAGGAIVEPIAFASGDLAEAAVAAGDIDAAIVGDATVIAEQPDAGAVPIARGALQQARLLERLAAAGVGPEVLADAAAVDLVTTADEEDGAGEGLAYVSVILLFIVITTYGQWVMMGVLEEKTTGVAEQVVSAVGARPLLAGKVLGIGVLGLGQLLVVIVAAVVLGGALDLFSLPEATYAAAAWSLVWFVLGFAFYAVLYAAAGSLVARVEDAQTAAMPVVLVGVAAYLVSLTLIVADPSSAASRIVSLIPPASPVAFPARIGAGAVPLWEILLGVALTAAATYGVIRLAARIYAGALLSASGRVKLRQAWRASKELAG